MKSDRSLVVLHHFGLGRTIRTNGFQAAVSDTSSILSFLMLKYNYIFQIKYTEAVLLNSNRKLLWFEITKMLIAVLIINLLCYFKSNFRHFRSL